MPENTETPASAEPKPEGGIHKLADKIEHVAEEAAALPVEIVFETTLGALTDK